VSTAELRGIMLGIAWIFAGLLYYLVAFCAKRNHG
jgi:hypothetical protein